ncbi:hypothetical protein JTB14_006581 [Gonioctena quinquepunctata]|nr:hypothetical protein JTB14_006581 [Gonioctena quinquepunctata]
MFFNDDTAMKNMLKTVLKEYFEPLKHNWEEERRELKATVEALRSGLDQQNKLSEEINNHLRTLSDENKDLRMRVEKLETEINTETIIHEMVERQNRASNVILFNVNEVNESDSRTRMQMEKKSLRDIINNVDSFRYEDFKFQRLGKYYPQKTRPIKVSFQNKEVAIKLMKS